MIESAEDLASARTGRRQEESEQRRQRILESARRCFGQQGYAGATVAVIAEQAGVSNGLLYQFFSSKKHLFEVVLRELVGDWVRAMVPRNPAQESAAAALEGMFRRSVEFCRSHPLLPALMSADPALQLERLKVAAKDRVEPHRELVAGILAGEFRGDLDVTSVADLICQIHADYSRRAYANDPMFPADPALIDAAVRFIHDAVRAG